MILYMIKKTLDIKSINKMIDKLLTKKKENTIITAKFEELYK